MARDIDVGLRIQASVDGDGNIKSLDKSIDGLDKSIDDLDKSNQKTTRSSEKLNASHKKSSTSARDLMRRQSLLSRTTAAVARAMTSARARIRETSTAARQQTTDLRSTETGWSSLKKIVVGVFAAIGVSVVAAGRQILATLTDYDTFKTRLETAFGGVSNLAESAFRALEEFATKTPFTLDQSVGAFTKLANLGIKPTEERLTSFGNTSSAMGESLNDLIEAVADAATGEFERLKTFGIKSRKQGDDVAFTFRGVTTTVRNESTAIVDYLTDIGNTNFAGAMERQMNRLPGLISNLADNIAGVWRDLGDAGLGDVIRGWLRSAISFVVNVRRIIKNGFAREWLSAALGQWATLFSDTYKLIGEYAVQFLNWYEKNVVKPVAEFLTGKNISGDQSAWAEYFNAIGAAMMTLPSNMSAVVTIMIGEADQMRIGIVEKLKLMLNSASTVWEQIRYGAEVAWNFVKLSSGIATDFIIKQFANAIDQIGDSVADIPLLPDSFAGAFRSASDSLRGLANSESEVRAEMAQSNAVFNARIQTLNNERKTITDTSAIKIAASNSAIRSALDETAATNVATNSALDSAAGHKQASNAANDHTATLDELADSLGIVDRSTSAATDSVGENTGALNEWKKSITTDSQAAEILNQKIDYLSDLLRDGTIDLTEYNRRVTALTESKKSLKTSTDSSASALDSWKKSITTDAEAADILNDKIEHLGELLRDGKIDLGEYDRRVNDLSASFETATGMVEDNEEKTKTWRETLSGSLRSTSEISNTTVNSMLGSWTQFWQGVFTGNAEDSAKNLFKTIYAQFVSMVAQMVAHWTATKIFEYFGGENSGGGGGGSGGGSSVGSVVGSVAKKYASDYVKKSASKYISSGSTSTGAGSSAISTGATATVGNTAAGAYTGTAATGAQATALGTQAGTTVTAGQSAALSGPLSGGGTGGSLAAGSSTAAPATTGGASVAGGAATSVGIAAVMYAAYKMSSRQSEKRREEAQRDYQTTELQGGFDFDGGAYAGQGVHGDYLEINGAIKNTIALTEAAGLGMRNAFVSGSNTVVQFGGNLNRVKEILPDLRAEHGQYVEDFVNAENHIITSREERDNAEYKSSITRKLASQNAIASIKLVSDDLAGLSATFSQTFTDGRVSSEQFASALETGIVDSARAAELGISHLAGLSAVELQALSRMAGGSARDLEDGYVSASEAAARGVRRFAGGSIQEFVRFATSARTTGRDAGEAFDTFTETGRGNVSRFSNVVDLAFERNRRNARNLASSVGAVGDTAKSVAGDFQGIGNGVDRLNGKVAKITVKTDFQGDGAPAGSSAKFNFNFGGQRARGGIVNRRAMYELAEDGRELVLPNDVTEFLLREGIPINAPVNNNGSVDDAAVRQLISEVRALRAAVNESGRNVSASVDNVAPMIKKNTADQSRNDRDHEMAMTMAAGGSR